MTVAYEWKPDSPKLDQRGSIELVEAVVPILFWRAPVTKLVAHGLSVVERFVIEAALQLGVVTVADVVEVTGLPEHLVVRVMSHIAAVGVLEVVQRDRSYAVMRDRARESLAAEQLFESHPATLTLLYLPRTDDLVAFEDAAVPLIHRITPVFSAPMPEDLHQTGRAAFLDRRIQLGAVEGLPDWVHTVVADETPFPETCPAYRSRGWAGKDTGILSLLDHNDRHRAPTVEMAAPNGMVGWISRLSANVGGALAAYGQARTTASTGDPARIIKIGADVAQRMSDDRHSVVRPLRLEVADRSERLVVAVAVRLEPADEAAKAVFALSRAVNTVLETPLDELDQQTVQAGIREAMTEYGHEVTGAQVRSALWRRSEFHRVYVLRAMEDFAYA
ncbi:hypothetical protein [Fodinicola acaciae]|uniref:hypothetical protein n=1 Tax=Fodinicola acaciae TaxID=2681555 RepID=UPI0013D2B27F|nr:hypothetical protein [Fodinicola acaciae]